ncbi:MAG TPA: shikimate dehydrogenase [Euryarchaeota archaeon]|nr:shikimate dehydrogenase [archaeon BMS3Bbin15]HDL14877.1 shikimate dehydrogenase [Euryarchaeota archaeon]
MCNINSKTRVFAVIGSPIEHSISPEIHNSSFSELKLNYVYVAYRVERLYLREAVEGFKALGYSGVNVTIPHKIEIMSYLEEISPESKEIGAVNTIVFKNSRATGYNTDGTGALLALREAGVKVENSRVVILGYGGAARAIAITLAMRGNIESIAIAGRNVKKAGTLAEDIKKLGIPAQSCSITGVENIIKDSNILINSTPVGMSPETEETLLTREKLHSELAVMDIVYTPLETRLLKEAKKAGCRTVDGLGMLIHQAAEAERLWLGVEPDISVMRNAAMKALKLS